MTSPKISSRPLSPHLQVWKWTLTMALSILHRATGVALAVGMLMLVWMLVAAASGPDAYKCFHSFATSIIGQLMLLGWTWAIFHHLGSGIRHLLMDMGYLINVRQSTIAGYIIIVFALTMTLAIWASVKMVGV